MEFLDTVRLVENEFKKSIGTAKISSSKQTLFATEVALIGHAVRAGYLVDAVTLKYPGPAFSDLLRALREKSPHFSDVIHLYDTANEQSFFVNAPVLIEIIDAQMNLPQEQNLAIETTDRPSTSFIQLTARDLPRLLPRCPNQVDSLLKYLRTRVSYNNNSPLPCTVTLPEDLAPRSAIPLAAMLLEYPVAYVPTSDDTSFILSRVPLDVYDCVLTWPSRREDDNQASPSQMPLLSKHTLLKFSCPSGPHLALAGTNPHLAHPPSPDQVRINLATKFERRIGPLPLGTTLEVHHTVETLDRVAL